MKKTIVLLIITTTIFSCGTTGHIQFYKYNQKKEVVEINLLEVINENNTYSPPKKWNNYELGIDSIYDIFVQFSSNPKEIYQLDFIGTPSDWEEESASKLALVGVFDGEKWSFEKDLSSKEQERMKNRFETEILSKMKYKYTKED